MNKIRYGIIGVGNQGSYYARLFKENKVTNGVLVAVCDINESKLDNLKSLFNDEVKYFNNHNSLLDSNLCDAVIIVTPHYFHPSIAIDFLKKDVSVILDKPAGVYTKQVKEMNEVSKNSKAKFTMMFNQRTNSVYRMMKEMIDNKEIGELQRVTWIITDWFRTESYYRNGSWRATWKGEGGGVLINQCPHQLDLLQWIVGLPKKVNAFCHYGKWHDIEVEDDVTAYLEFSNGATGVFVTTTGEAPGSNRFEVSGSKGKLICENDTLIFYKNELDNIKVCKESSKGFDTPKVEIIKVETDNKNEQHLGIINNFTNSLLGLEEQFVDGKEGINNVELMNAIELSGFRNGESVSLPVNEEEYLLELNKRRALSKFKESNDDVVMDTSNSF